MAKIPSKQLHRAGTKSDLTQNLLGREIGYNVEDCLLYIKDDNGVLHPSGFKYTPGVGISIDSDNTISLTEHNTYRPKNEETITGALRIVQIDNNNNSVQIANTTRNIGFLVPTGGNAGDILTIKNSNGNIGWDNSVMKGPISSTDSHVAIFDGTTGNLVKDSGFTIEKSVPPDAQFSDTTYSEATDHTYGLVKTGYTDSGKTYAVQLSDGKMYVSVPWENTWVANSASSAGYVESSFGKPNCVWMTDGDSAPYWGSYFSTTSKQDTTGASSTEYHVYQQAYIDTPNLGYSLSHLNYTDSAEISDTSEIYMRLPSISSWNASINNVRVKASHLVQWLGTKLSSVFAPKSHSDNGTIHVTSQDKVAWNTAVERSVDTDVYFATSITMSAGTHLVFGKSADSDLCFDCYISTDAERTEFQVNFQITNAMNTWLVDGGSTGIISVTRQSSQASDADVFCENKDVSFVDKTNWIYIAESVIGTSSQYDCSAHVVADFMLVSSDATRSAYLHIDSACYRKGGGSNLFLMGKASLKSVVV